VSEHEHTEHIVSPGTYLAIILTLLALTGITVFAALLTWEDSTLLWRC